jgi:uncharacterized protein (TIGR02996 family)
MSITALESQLRAHLDDWDCWLVYGDWLTDQGDERGTFIRLEHRMETEPVSPEEKRELQRQMDQLVLTHGDTWKVPAPDGVELVWSHGFVVGARRSQRYHPRAPLAELLEHPQARMLARLELNHGAVYNDEIEDLAASPGLSHVTSLALGYNHLDDSAAQALAWSPYTGELTALHLQHNILTEDGVAALAHSSLLGQLRTLDLRDNPLGPGGARFLAGSPWIARLGLLHLYLDDIGPEGARALSQCAHPTLSRYWRARCP